MTTVNTTLPTYDLVQRKEGKWIITRTTTTTTTRTISEPMHRYPAINLVVQLQAAQIEGSIEGAQNRSNSK